uniref:BTB domain-containing protein n=1 Tax=Panagrolaimus sp. ES5 TaxID=591445 RepID=A0AC34FYZ8_9BILA
MAQVSLKTTVVEYPFALEWTISEDWLKSFDDFDQNGFLISDTYTVFGDSKITYFLDIFPNGNKDEREGETWIFLNINYENEPSIIVESSFSIPSAKWCHQSEDIYGKNATLGLDDWLKSFDDFDQYGFLISDTYTVFGDSEITYFLDIFPNGNKDEREGETWIFLNINYENETSIIVESSFSIPSAKWCHQSEDIYDKNDTLGLGETCCSTYDFFDPSKKFIVDGKFTIKIHKCVLGLQSAVFAAMFKQENEEIEIPDFTFEIVEKAIKLCYHRNLVPDFDIYEAVLLLKFAEKYAIIDLKENLENYLGNNLNAANVCELVNCAIDENALKLQKKCTNFLMNCFSKKKFVPKMEILDKTFLVNVLNNLSCHECQTL